MSSTQTKKPDRRVLKTKTAIKKAFESLLLDTSYNKITITAIAKRADIDRKTFYTHYSSVDDVLDDIVLGYTNDCIKDINASLIFEDPEKATSIFFVNLNDFIQRTLPLRKRFLESFPFERILNFWTVAVRKKILEGPIPAKADPTFLEYAIEFYLGGVVCSYGA